MTLRALWPVVNQFQNKNGSILTAGKVYVYYKNRTTLAEIFSDEAGTIVSPNPVLLDNNGRATVFADTIYSYTIVVCDYYGKELFSQDITIHYDSSAAKDVLVTGTDGSVKVDTTDLPNGVRYDLSVNTNILSTNEYVDAKIDNEEHNRIYEDGLIRQSIPTKTSQLENDSRFLNKDIIINERSPIHLTPLQKYSSYINVNNLSTRLSGYIDNNIRIATIGTSVNVTSDFTPEYSDTDGVGHVDWPAIAYFEIANFVATEMIRSYTMMYDNEYMRSYAVGIICNINSNKFSISLNRNNIPIQSGWYNIIPITIMY